MKFKSLALLLPAVAATTYFQEQFSDDWESRWVQSTDWKAPAEMGKWVHTAGTYYADENDKGVQTGDDARHYGMSAKMGSNFNNEGKDLVLQFTVKHDQNLDCGGAYIKLMPSGIDQASFGGDTDYSIMFGPDMCGYTKRTHVIFTYKGENLLKNTEMKCESDSFTHLYTLIVKPDNTYIVKIDNEEKASGKLADDFNFLKPKEINDPDQSKPTDWVEESRIPDPAEIKPAGYDDIPEQIPDPDAAKPEDWDDEDDGEWEPPMLENPDFKGEWNPSMIENPDYKGEWEHPQVANPDFVEDDSLYHSCKDCGFVGFELWQVKAGTIFDDIIVTDSVDEADALVERFQAKQDGEKKMEAAAMKVKADEKAAADAAKAEADADDEPELETELHDEL